MLRVRTDFDSMVAVFAAHHEWIASPEAGVDRVMLDRIGDEVAVATSIVRYRPHSRFAEHLHERGEEFLVLEGIFADEHHTYPQGSYVRNPPGSRHSPRSDAGCTLFVKLRQFLADDRDFVLIDTTRFAEVRTDRSIQSRTLHQFGPEEVTLIDGGIDAEHSFPAAATPREILMLSGEADVLGNRMARWDWLRVPAGKPLPMRFVRAGRAFVKTRPVIE